MDRIFDEMLKWSYPHFGEIKRYKVVDEDEYDIVPKEAVLKRLVQNTESRIDTQRRLKQKAIEEYDRRIAELEEELQRQKKRLKP